MRSASDNLCLEPISCSEMYAHKSFRNHKLFLKQHLPSHEEPLKIMVMGTHKPLISYHVLCSIVAMRMWVHSARFSVANVNCPSCTEGNITMPFSNQWSIASVFLEKQSSSVCCCSWHGSLEMEKHLIVCIPLIQAHLKKVTEEKILRFIRNLLC